jgi:hypothetical protein
MLTLPGPLENGLYLLALLAILALVVSFCLRIPLGGDKGGSGAKTQQGLPPHFSVWLVLAFSSLLIPQLVTRAHENHTYAGLVLLIPFAIASRRVLLTWSAMVGIHFYAHLASFQLGRAIVLPQLFLGDAQAQPLISQIQAVLATRTYEPLLQFQGSVNQLLAQYLPLEPVVSVLSVVQFICLVLVLREMFALTPHAVPGAILDSRLGTQSEP